MKEKLEEFEEELTEEIPVKERRFNAGYEITDSLHIGNTEFVIGYNEDEKMFVTWQVRNGDYYFWGHYFNSREAAEKNLIDRARDEWVRQLGSR